MLGSSSDDFTVVFLLHQIERATCVPIKKRERGIYRLLENVTVCRTSARISQKVLSIK
jgi:hypothetical protein